MRSAICRPELFDPAPPLSGELHGHFADECTEYREESDDYGHHDGRHPVEDAHRHEQGDRRHGG